MSENTTLKDDPLAPPPRGAPMPLTPEEQLMDEDVEWCYSDPDIRRRYGEQVVVVYHKQILGAGPHHDAADEAARAHPAYPDDGYVAYVVVPPWLEENPLPQTFPA